MKILHTVESYLPSRHGMQEVVTQLSERLQQMGHEVTIATSAHPQRTSHTINGVTIASFDVHGNAVNGITGDAGSYQQFLLSGQFDIVTNFAAQQWATDLALPILQQIKARKVFVPTGFSALHAPAYQAYFQQMQHWMKLYDAHVFLAEQYRDINFAREHGVKGLHIIPNGANELEFDQAPPCAIRKLIGVPESWKLVITVGNHTGYKGHAAAMQIFSKAGVSESVLLIVGNAITRGNAVINAGKELVNLAGLKHTNCSWSCKSSALLFNSVEKKRRIVVQQFDRPTTINAFKQADLFLFPSMIECSPIVLFESLAARTPFLTTDVGNAAEIVGWTNGGQIMPTSIEAQGYSMAQVAPCARQLQQLLQAKEQLKQMGESGHAAFLEKFTWQKIAHRYNDLYCQLMKST